MNSEVRGEARRAVTRIVTAQSRLFDAATIPATPNLADTAGAPSSWPEVLRGFLGPSVGRLHELTEITSDFAEGHASEERTLERLRHLSASQPPRGPR